MLGLAEKGIDDWIGHKLNILRQEHLTKAYLALNPLGVIPTLVDCNAVITDSAVILEYLDEMYPQSPRLLPENPVVRSHARAWCRRLDSTDALRVITFQKRALPAFAELEPTAFDQIAVAHPTREQWYRTMGQDGFDANTLASAHATIAQILRDAGQHLATSSSPWLLGDSLSIADLVTAPLVERIIELGLEEMVSAVPPLMRWHQMMRERPAYLRVYS